MREILFKAKRIDNGEWIEGYYSTHPHPFSGFLKDFIFAPYYDKEKECGYDNGYQIDVKTLCQYTGLTDKNGNKIWENDVVIYDNSSYSAYCVPHTGKIAWRNGCLCFKHWLYGSISYKSFLSDDFFGAKCEVIGNTIDNPELLDNKTEF